MRNYHNYEAKSLKDQFIGIKVIGNKVEQIAAANGEKYTRKLLDSSYQRIKRLFVLAYNNTASNDQVSVDSFKNIFFQELK